MSDEIDRAQSYIEIQEVTSIQNHLNRVEEERSINPEGYCHNCYEEVSPSQLFCNGKCASEHYKK